MALHFTLFDTRLGQVGLAWTGAGLRGVQLPEGDAARTRARLLRRFPSATPADPPPSVASALARIQAVLDGTRDDLGDLELDAEGVPVFARHVYRLARAIPPGRTRSYGELARDLGDPTLARAVGQALGSNPWPIIVPCHRVLAADGSLHGFSAHGGTDTKARMLRIEGAEAGGAPSLFDDAEG